MGLRLIWDWWIGASGLWALGLKPRSKAHTLIIERAHIGPPTPLASHASENAVSPTVSHKYLTHTHRSLPYPLDPPRPCPLCPTPVPHLHPLFLCLYRYSITPPAGVRVGQARAVRLAREHGHTLSQGVARVVVRRTHTS